MLLHLVDQATNLLIQQPPPTNGGGPDFSNISPNDNGLPKAGMFVLIAQVLLWAGLGMMFLVFVWGLIAWGGGSAFKNTGWSEDAKAKITKAGLGGLALTAAGAIWSWIIALD